MVDHAPVASQILGTGQRNGLGKLKRVTFGRPDFFPTNQRLLPDFFDFAVRTAASHCGGCILSFRRIRFLLIKHCIGPEGIVIDLRLEPWMGSELVTGRRGQRCSAYRPASMRTRPITRPRFGRRYRTNAGGGGRRCGIEEQVGRHPVRNRALKTVLRALPSCCGLPQEHVAGRYCPLRTIQCR